ncbi:Hypothetical protein GbCGDNIH3_1596 [Granulibacter bethesdensis]|uniref:Uncharacterized protein n=1 Tax=Granulibacter bethesdensis TaxID=364410 RepID=A0AAN1AMG4_9PROT|nr:Hypothetical protein GbCGDNIH3_1596 [Granulibacter bethesdensis]
MPARTGKRFWPPGLTHALCRISLTPRNAMPRWFLINTASHEARPQDMKDAPVLPPDKYIVMGGDLTHCLWSSKGEMILLADLPISQDLTTRLQAWEDWADDFEDFLPPEERAPFDLEGFTEAGLEIARALKAELPDYTILYCDESRWQARKELGLTPAECRYEV